MGCATIAVCMLVSGRRVYDDADMATSKPINLQVSDLIKWFRDKELVVNEMFQRHSVWTPSAKTYLIDTVLNELPLPKIYFRSILNPKKQTAIREIVDGQQRIRTLVSFANNELRLSNRSPGFEGKKYDDLTEEEQNKFLGYLVTAEQLLNATDDDVIDIFGRLNSYTVSLNSAEKRHARFQTEFKFAVRKASQLHREWIERFSVFSTRQRFRMQDDAFFAEVFGLFLRGIMDGGESNITKLYEQQTDDVFTSAEADKVLKRIGWCLSFLEDKIADALQGEHLSKHYQILILLAALAHAKWGIPDSGEVTLPVRRQLVPPELMLERLSVLEKTLQDDPPNTKLKAFYEASKSSTHRIASRRARFPVFYDAVTAQRWTW
ncbi:MAG: DUF262 domain-containing protein [Tepidisphaeraceae bacterium]